MSEVDLQISNMPQKRFLMTILGKGTRDSSARHGKWVFAVEDFSEDILKGTRDQHEASQVLRRKDDLSDNC